MNRRLVQVIAACAGGLALWWTLRDGHFASHPGSASTERPAQTARNVEQQASPASAAASVAPYRLSPFGAPPATEPSAVETLTEARQYGDDRAPPIDNAADADQPPTPWELSDPAKYLEYETRQDRAVKERFLHAVNSRLPAWRESLELARARGASAEDLARAQDKIRRLEEAMQATLRDDTQRR